MTRHRLIIIGLDGVPFGLLKGFAETGVMPNIRQIIQSGTIRQMRSAIPEISSVAWSSIITGQNPAEHGIFGFTDLQPGTYTIRFPNFNDLKAPPFWNLAEGKSIIINVPATYPVKEMNGVHISGFVSIDINKSVHPAWLVPELKKLDYRLDVDAQKAHEDMGLFLKDLDETLTGRIKAYEYLWDYIDWQTFMLTFTGTDRLMHFLWEACEDKNHKYHSDFLNHFRRIDETIGNITAKTTENDILILLSDHGFERLDKEVYINYLLAEEGLLAFRRNTEPNLADIDYSTKAFALDPGRIYINQKGKYPAGSVSPDDKAGCLNELENLFSSFEIDGRKVIKHIHRAEDIYHGPYIEGAPDLVLIAEKGFNLKGSMACQQLTARGPFTGKHTYHDAFFLTNSGRLYDTLPDELSVTEAGKIIKSFIRQR